jgi:hypothetical protein
MVQDTALMQAVEQLRYRATVGDVAAQAGLEINRAQQGLLALATAVGGHLQVAESGDVIYQFPHNFRAILWSKSLQLRLRAWSQALWNVAFYLIRISFGILLLVSILLILITIGIIVFSFSSKDDDRGSGGSRDGEFGGIDFFPGSWLSPDLGWIFFPDFGPRRHARYQPRSEHERLSFLEAVFSFLFGDGNPNADLETKRWQSIAGVIRNQQGAVVAEQIVPYLDDVKAGDAHELDDYMLPVLSRFDGRPEVTPEGELVYVFPELQTTVTESSPQSIAPYLQEQRWQFSRAGSGQKIAAISLGSLNLVGALTLGALLQSGEAVAELGGIVALVASIYWVLLGYGTAFLVIPLMRYFWIQQRNQYIRDRNQRRQHHAALLATSNATLSQKLAYAEQLATHRQLRSEDIVYTTEQDLLDQELQRQDAIDAEWQRRLQNS